MKIMCRLIMCIVIALFMSNSSKAQYEQDYSTGLIWDSRQDIEEHLQESYAVESTLPSFIDMEESFPEPGNQGSQNSCTAWAVGYALRSHMEGARKNWEIYDREHTFSPGYIYNQLIDGTDSGCSIIAVMNLIAEQGVCTMSSFTYDESDFLTQPTDSQRAEARHFRIKAWNAVKGQESIKKCLADGTGVIVGINISSDFKKISVSNPIFDVKSQENLGSHSICLIGYDDTINAYKFINSWGTEWGINGYGWISYDMVGDADVNEHGANVGFTMELDDIVYSEDFFDYKIVGNEAVITDYFGIDGNVVIPDSMDIYPVTAICDEAFKNCYAIETVMISDSVKSIGKSAFENCLSLKSTMLGDGVSEISANVFKGCKALKSVYFGNSLISVNSSAFNGCIELNEFSISQDNPNFAVLDGVLFDKELKTLVMYPRGRIGDYVIPESTSIIASSAFSKCSFLTGITICDAVENIGGSAFFGCTSLKTVLIPERVSVMGDFAFSECESLTEVIILPGLSEINSGVFAECTALKNVYIPGSVTHIYSWAFKDCTSITCAAIPDSVIFIADTAFMEYSPTGYIYSLPNLEIQCHKYSYAYVYAAENKINVKEIDVIISEKDGFYKLYSDIPLSCTLIISNYTTNGKLVEINAKTLENISEYEFTLENTYASITKIMVWDSLDNICPIADAITIK